MAVRKVSGRGGNIIGRFPSLKLGRMVDFESLIERDYLYLLDFETAVTWFAEQPLVIEYEANGKQLKYTPDFHLIRGGRHFLVECKPEKMMGKPQNQRKFAAGQDFCAEKNWTFQVMTDTQLRAGFRLSNVRLLTQFARYDPDPRIKQTILAFLSAAAAPVPMAEVMVRVAPHNPQAVKIRVLQMAFHHELSIPLDNAPISPALPVALPET